MAFIITPHMTTETAARTTVHVQTMELYTYLLLDNRITRVKPVSICTMKEGKIGFVFIPTKQNKIQEMTTAMVLLTQKIQMMATAMPMVLLALTMRRSLNHDLYLNLNQSENNNSTSTSQSQSE